MQFNHSSWARAASWLNSVSVLADGVCRWAAHFLQTSVCVRVKNIVQHLATAIACFPVHICRFATDDGVWCWVTRLLNLAV
jgi:hypothetical protein